MDVEGAEAIVKKARFSEKVTQVVMTEAVTQTSGAEKELFQCRPVPKGKVGGVQVGHHQ